MAELKWYGYLLAAGALWSACGPRATPLEPWRVPLADPPGFLHRDVRVIYREPGKDVLWFGTEGGATRYDMKKDAWVTYTVADGLSDNSVQAICSEPGGDAIWFGTRGKGASRYDRRAGRWKKYTAGVGGLINNTVQSIQEEPGGGALWFGTGGGTSRYDLDSGQWQSFTAADGLVDGNVLAIRKEPGGDALWFGTEGGASRYDLVTGRWRSFNIADGLVHGPVQAIQAEPGDGALWFGTEGGASRYDLTGGVWKTFTAVDGLADNAVYAIEADSEDGSLWFGTSRGVSRYDRLAGEWERLTTAEGLVDDFVRSVRVEPGGAAIWFATRGAGASRYEPSTGRWQSFTPREARLADAAVYAIENEPEGDALWFGTRQGASRYEPSTGRWQSFAAADGLADDAVYAIKSEPGARALWFGTRLGVSRYDLDNHSWRSFTTNDGLVDNAVQAIQAEPGGRALWFGTFQGVSRYELATGLWKSFTEDDGLASDNVPAIEVEPGGKALWFGTIGPPPREDRSIKGGVSRYDLASRQWQSFTTNDGLPSNAVQAIQAEPGGKRQHADDLGALWFGTADGLSRYDLNSGNWKGFSTEDGLISNDVRAIWAVPAARTLWFGTRSGLSRYDLNSNRWESFVAEDGLLSSYVSAIHVEAASGAIWFATVGGGVSRAACIEQAHVADRGSWINVQPRLSPTAAHLTIAGDRLVRTRPAGLLAVDLEAAESELWPLPNRVLAIASGPEGRLWVGSRFGGLRLQGAQGAGDQLRLGDGLPSMDVSVLSTIPGTGGAEVWAGTAGGAVRFRAVGDVLHLVQTATYKSGLPAGPVDALAAASDGSVFLAYNSVDARCLSAEAMLGQRSLTHVRHLGPDGNPSLQIVLPGVEIHALALSPPQRRLGFVTHPETLWAATSTGLFEARNPRRSGSLFVPVTAGALAVATPLRTVAINHDGNVWVMSQEQRNASPIVIGYRPDAAVTSVINATDIHPEGGSEVPPLDDFAFTDRGEIVVLAGSRVAGGHVVPRSPQAGFVVNAILDRAPELAAVLLVTILAWAGFAIRRHPQVLDLRARPENLRGLPFPQIPGAIRRLRWAWALGGVLKKLNLGPERAGALVTLTGQGHPDSRHLHSLAQLLGAEVPEPEKRVLAPGLQLLIARLPAPAMLRNVATPLVAFDIEVNRDADPASLRDRLDRALVAAKHRTELPFLLLCRDRARGRAIVPAGRDALVFSERELREILFALSPRQTLTGVLLTRDLLALSPYNPRGPVKDPEMFYGRDRLMRQLLFARDPHALLVGPRRVGKTSVLRRLADKLPQRRPELDVVSMNFLAVKNFAQAVHELVRTLAPSRSAASEPSPGNEAEWLKDLLARRFRPERPGLLLIDEADILVEVDEARGYPWISTLRSLHAEGLCSVILTGYWHLFRRTLEHANPLLNMAQELRLGPLVAKAGYDLATEPMGRYGFSWDDPELPAHLVARTGGYPDLIQAVCGQMLEELKRQPSLQLTRTLLEAAERSTEIRYRLFWSFGNNALRAGQVMVDRLLERNAFTASEALEALERATGRDVPLAIGDRLIQQLILYGFVADSEGVLTWTIPLLRETLLRDPDRDRRRQRLLAELAGDSHQWVERSKHQRL